MTYEYKTRRRVTFAETDMAGILHFSNLFRYMEDAEHKFLRSLGLSVHTTIEDGFVSFPRVSADCQFKNPLRFEDEVEIHMVVREMTNKAIVYDFIFRNAEKPGDEIARGSMTVICAMKVASDDRMRSMTIPDSISTKIDVAPQELLTALGKNKP